MQTILFLGKEPMKNIAPSLTKESFGEHLAMIRKAKGFTQKELGERIGVSQRVVAYYEKETKHPPSNYLPIIAKALKISIDELMGLKLTKEDLSPKNPKLWKRLRKIDRLPPNDQKMLVHYLDKLLKDVE